MYRSVPAGAGGHWRPVQKTSPSQDPNSEYVSMTQKILAEREGFEPSERLRAQRFSRPPRSTTPAPLRDGDAQPVSGLAGRSGRQPYGIGQTAPQLPFLLATPTFVTLPGPGHSANPALDSRAVSNHKHPPVRAGPSARLFCMFKHRCSRRPPGTLRSGNRSQVRGAWPLPAAPQGADNKGSGEHPPRRD